MSARPTTCVFVTGLFVHFHRIWSGFIELYSCCFKRLILVLITGLVDDDEEDPPETDVPVINGWISSLLDTSVATTLLGEEKVS